MKHFFANFLSHNFLCACVLMVALFATSCKKDHVDPEEQHGDILRFAVTQVDGSETLSQDIDVESKGESPASQVLSLRGDNPADTLFLHASVTDGIATSHPDVQTNRSLTRATPVDKETFYDSFGVLASVYTGTWSEESCLPDYMYNVNVTKASSWTTSYYWPGAGQNIRFFAYAPYNGQGIVLSDKTSTGTPSITYTVPANVADQKDLLVAATPGMDGNTNADASLSFAHALTAVRFTTGDDMMAGSITEITLKGVYGSGRHKLDSGSWDNYGKVADFSQTLWAQTDGSADQEITPVETTFMMLPQELPSGASIEVVYTDDLTMMQHTLTTSIEGTEWPMGKTVTYRISESSIDITPTFVVTAPSEDFTYAGGTKNYSVTSYITISRKGETPQTKPVAWTAEFVEDNGNGGYDVIDKPEWITAFTDKDAGSTSDNSFTVIATAQQGTTDSNPHNDNLKAESLVSNYDLSTEGSTKEMNTANCYVINAPGTYSLPLVYGNAIKNGQQNVSSYTSSKVGQRYVLDTFVNHLNNPITNPYIYENEGCDPEDAVLVWQDEQGLVTNVQLSEDKQKLTFNVPQATIKQGNAVVAVRDKEENIMWSWHIWVTDFKPGQDPTIEERYDPSKTQQDKEVTNYQGKKYIFMGVNIGWCDGGAAVYAARSVKVRFKQNDTGKEQFITLTQTQHMEDVKPGNNPYFQWGRKDPMLPSIGTENTNKTWYDAEGNASTEQKAVNWTTNDYPIAKNILHPNTHCFNQVMDQMYYNLWSADNTVELSDDEVIKTIYDPSPVGYHVPPSNAFTGFTYNGRQVQGWFRFGSQFNSPDTIEDEFDKKLGFEFYCNKMNGDSQYNTEGGTIFFPASGHRNGDGPQLSGVCENGSYWSAGPYGSSRGYYLYFYKSFINPISYSYRSNSYAVRPVREK